MMKPTKYTTILMLLILVLSGCSSQEIAKEDIFQLKGSYVGDNSAVGSIVRQLPAGEYLEYFELATKETPYGITLNYRNFEEAVIEEAVIREKVLYNATFIFALVQNADWIKFNFADRSHTVTREQLQDWYNIDRIEFTDRGDLEKFTGEYIEDESKVNLFFEK